MLQYILAFLLINTCYQSLGKSISQNGDVHSVSDSLLALTKHCENKFIIDQINSKLQECNVTAPPYKIQQFQCLMFYDINMRLCSVASKLALDDDYSSKINEEQDVNTFCTTKKDFIFTNISEYSNYYSLAENINKMAIFCSKVCGYSDIGNLNTNYYCKYFKWGTDMLKIQNPPLSNTISNFGSPPTASNPGNSASSVVSEIDANSADISVIKSSSSNPEPSKTSNVLVQAPSVMPINVSSKSTSSTIEQPNAQPVEKPADAIIHKQTEQNQLTSIVKQDDKKTSSDFSLNEETLNDPTITSPRDILSGGDKGKQPITGKEATNKLPAGNVLNTNKHEQDEQNPELKLENDNDYEDDKDPIDGEENPIEENIEQEQVFPKTPLEKNRVDIPPYKEYYPHPDTDEFTEDGNDNFFSFFLTIVVVIVLLYILYHNKNKVSKLFFGLVFEGRQTSRRRNSRGHAYRRLDTLEQAMSTNTAAPPSKIIY